MVKLTTHQEICRHFSGLLSYPDERVADRTVRCLAKVEAVNREASSPLERFLAFIESNELARIEEAFTGTFDLQALCHPYVGYQLCGESQQRTMFMIKLRELYRQFEFAAGNELPDHLTEVLRFIGLISDTDCRNEIIQDGLLPALDKLIQGIENEDNPYLALLFSLQCFLSEGTAPDSERLSTEQQEEYSS